MEIIILAGGLGTRLKDVVKDVPKPMAQINGKPFLEHLMSYLKKFDPERFVLSVGYKYQTIQSHFNFYFEGVPIIYSIEREPLGTGGAIKAALKYCREDFIYVINGDTFFNVNLQEIPKSQNLTIAALNVKINNRYGQLIVKENILTSFAQIGNIDNQLINGGVYLIKRDIFERFQCPEKFSFETDFLTKHLKELSVLVIEFKEYFIDIGVPEDYDKAKEDFKKSIIY